jgi:hypothetical protein
MHTGTKGSTLGDKDGWSLSTVRKLPGRTFVHPRMIGYLPPQDAPAFQPTAVYDADGDCIEFLSRPDPFHAERVDDLVTVYRSQDSGEIIGSLIKGVHPLLEKHPGLRIEVQDGKVRLVHLIRARLWASKLDPMDILSVTYRKLIEVAEESNVETELTPVAR